MIYLKINTISLHFIISMEYLAWSLKSFNQLKHDNPTFEPVSKLFSVSIKRSKQVKIQTLSVPFLLK